MKISLKVTEKKYRIDFRFDCNSCCVVYFKEYIWSTVVRFNKCKSNVKLNGEERREFKQGKLIDDSFLCSHNGTHEDIKVQMIGHCDLNDQEPREDFWIFHLDTLHSQSLNQKRVLKY